MHDQVPRSAVEAAEAGLAEGQRVTWAGVGLNLLLTAVKLAAGFWGRSQALVADAAHSLSDLVSDLVVLVGLRMGRRRADAEHHFGHGRLETMATAAVGLVLVVGAAGLGYDAVYSILDPADGAVTWLAPAAAALSVIVKEALYRYTMRVGRRINSSLVTANAWHHRSDALSSLAALAGSGAAFLDPGLRVLDPVAALVVSLLVIKVAVGIIANALRELGDAAPPSAALAEIEACARGVAGVLGVHDLRVRSTGGVYQAELHVVVKRELRVWQGHSIAKEVERCIIKDIPEMGRIIVHVDPSPGPPPQTASN